MHHDPALEPLAQSVGDNRRPAFRLIQIGGNPRRFANEQLTVLVAVSYTHLDVYKGQIME